MKQLPYFLLLITIFFSCSKHNEPAAEVCGYKWQLIEMTGNIANVPPTTGKDMAWQEFYLLGDDSTFTKVRTRNETMMSQGGKYTFITSADGKYLKLTYDTQNDLIGSCYSNSKKETLYINAAEDMLTGTWQACDGPGLTYKKVPNACNGND